MTAIIRDDAEPVTSLAPVFLGRLRWIIERCMAKDPEERYAIDPRSRARSSKSA